MKKYHYHIILILICLAFFGAGFWIFLTSTAPDFDLIGVILGLFWASASAYGAMILAIDISKKV